MAQSKAVNATVDFGFVQVEGLMLPDGSYRISAQQANQFLGFSAHPNYVNRSLKRILDKDSQLIRVESENNPNPESVLSLPQFNLLLVELVSNGNETAKRFLQASAQEAIERRFDHAFGVKRTEEQRNEWLKQRMLHKKQFHPNLTRWLQADGCKEGKDYAAAVNRFKACANLPIKPVAEYSEDELTLLNNAEVSYNMARKLGHSHDESLRYL